MNEEKMHTEGKIADKVLSLLLLVVFFCVLTPISLIARVAGKEFLPLALRKDANSYWTAWRP
jgi:hypothetical protein